VSTLERRVPLSRFTTIGTGGPAALFARPRSLRELQELLALAAAERLPVETIGLGSNVLVADEGIEALVLRLEGELAATVVEGETLLAGGGARNATCLHRARAAGLGGLEFASAIPGTVGGGVRMNAGAYGSDFATVLVEATVVSAQATRTLRQEELGLGYRSSSLRPGEVVASARLALEPCEPAAIKQHVATLAAARKASQPLSARTFGSVFKNPPSGPGAGALIEQSGLKGVRVGGAVISSWHANFIENTGGASSADALALMAETRLRVWERFGVELTHEVALLGAIALPPL
jgi:UDP-N-acetylmuramate dehydrogenase